MTGNQINLNVEVLAIGQEINFTVHSTLEVSDCIQLMVDLISKEFSGVQFSSMPILVDLSSQSQLENSFRVGELPLLNGSKLLLI